MADRSIRSSPLCKTQHNNRAQRCNLMPALPQLYMRKTHLLFVLSKLLSLSRTINTRQRVGVLGKHIIAVQNFVAGFPRPLWGSFQGVPKEPETTGYLLSTLTPKIEQKIPQHASEDCKMQWCIPYCHLPCLVANYLEKQRISCSAALHLTFLGKFRIQCLCLSSPWFWLLLEPRATDTTHTWMQ